MKERARAWSQIVVGVIFLVAGFGKLLLPVVRPMLHQTVPTFGDVLAALHIPYPVATSFVVSGFELAGGLALLLRRYVQPVSALLAGDMIAALLTLSGPATFFGRPLVIGGFTLGNEFWRVPLEGTLLVLLIWFAARSRGPIRAV
jgi:uncharacterized membrane protein YphA (DoxX/SURF4 family)